MCNNSNNIIWVVLSEKIRSRGMRVLILLLYYVVYLSECGRCFARSYSYYYILDPVSVRPRPRNNVYFASTSLKRSEKYSPGVPSFVHFYYIIICVLTMTTTTTTMVCLISKTSGGKYLETCRGVRGYLINLKSHHTTSILRGGVTMFII